VKTPEISSISVAKSPHVTYPAQRTGDVSTVHEQKSPLRRDTAGHIARQKDLLRCVLFRRLRGCGVELGHNRSNSVLGDLNAPPTDTDQ